MKKILALLGRPFRWYVVVVQVKYCFPELMAEGREQGTQGETEAGGREARKMVLALTLSTARLFSELE